MFYQKISSFIQQQLKYISTTCQTAVTTSGKISKNNQFQNTHAGFTIFSVHSQHLKSSSSAFRPALSNLWLLLVIYPFQRMNNLAASFSKKIFFCVPNYIIISLQVTSPRTMKTTSLTRIYSNCLQSFIPE